MNRSLRKVLEANVGKVIQIKFLLAYQESEVLGGLLRELRDDVIIIETLSFIVYLDTEVISINRVIVPIPRELPCP